MAVRGTFLALTMITSVTLAACSEPDPYLPPPRAGEVSLEAPSIMAWLQYDPDSGRKRISGPTRISGVVLDVTVLPSGSTRLTLDGGNGSRVSALGRDYPAEHRRRIKQGARVTVHCLGFSMADASLAALAGCQLSDDYVGSR